MRTFTSTDRVAGSVRAPGRLGPARGNTGAARTNRARIRQILGGNRIIQRSAPTGGNFSLDPEQLERIESRVATALGQLADAYETDSLDGLVFRNMTPLGGSITWRDSGDATTGGSSVEVMEGIPKVSYRLRLVLDDAASPRQAGHFQDLGGGSGEIAIFIRPQEQERAVLDNSPAEPAAPDTSGMTDAERLAERLNTQPSLAELRDRPPPPVGLDRTPTAGIGDIIFHEYVHMLGQVILGLRNAKLGDEGTEDLVADDLSELDPAVHLGTEKDPGTYGFLVQTLERIIEVINRERPAGSAQIPDSVTWELARHLVEEAIVRGETASHQHLAGRDAPARAHGPAIAEYLFDYDHFQAGDRSIVRDDEIALLNFRSLANTLGSIVYDQAHPDI